MPNLTAGSFGAFEFEDVVSVQTLSSHKTKGSVSAKSHATYTLNQDSDYSIDTGANDIDFEHFDGIDNEDDGTRDETMRDFEVEMPPGGLNISFNEGDGGNDGENSRFRDVSPTLPNNLN